MYVDYIFAVVVHLPFLQMRFILLMDVLHILLLRLFLYGCSPYCMYVVHMYVAFVYMFVDLVQILINVVFIFCCVCSSML